MKQFFWVLFLIAGAAGAAPAAFRLGVSYSEWLSFPGSYDQRLATDNSGALYFLTTGPQSNANLSIVTKLTPDGKTILWQNQLGFQASAWTTDPTGGLYVVPAAGNSDTTSYVVKLSTIGTCFAWKRSVGFLTHSTLSIAADARGRVSVAGKSATSNFLVVRLNELGTADYATSIKVRRPQ